MATDLEIALAASPAPIEEVAWKLGLGVEDLVFQGPGVAKIAWNSLKARFDSPRGSLVLVTSVHPTPFGEGKTVTTIGLNQALNHIGKTATCTIREPSMGPVFGIKGGATGGGHAQVLPMQEINLHFTGDLHAVTSAHNLCSAMLDNHIYFGNERDIDTNRILWPRVIDMNDRSLRSVAVGLGGPHNGVAREERFDITAASEVMAILTLATDYADLRTRLGEIVVAETRSGYPVKADDIGAAGPMALLLRQAFLPNIAQTLENNPVFIHGGPFANIAHGNSSIVADRLALTLSDYVVTEAGFGADMGAEKMMHIKTAASGDAPDCVVINVTCRSMKLHGGAFAGIGGTRPSPSELATEDVAAVKEGVSTNLARHIRNMARFGTPIVVSINRFPYDTDDEIEALLAGAKAQGADDAVLCEVHQKGCEGGIDLANAVVRACQEHLAAGRPFEPLFAPNTPIEEKILRIATNIYGADSIDFSSKALKDLKRLEDWGYDQLDVCMAKTQYSFSHVPREIGAPSGFTLPIRSLRLNAGAGFVVAVCGTIVTMPGLPRIPAADDMDIDEDGNILGVFG